MTNEERDKYVRWHDALRELTVEWIRQNPGVRLGASSVLELMQWSQSKTWGQRVTTETEVTWL